MTYDLKTFQFGKGSHPSREKGMCVMEAVAYLAGEAHSDAPKCACPVITRLAIWVNDSCSDALRNELLRDLPWRIVGTKANQETEQQRAYMAADWAVRFVCPVLLDRAGLTKEAMALREHAPVCDKASAADAADAARAAARAAANAAADAAANAARAAADAAARAAADAAHAAANAAAYAAEAANAAARAAADAADDLVAIQRSCVELLDCMIRLTEPQEREVLATATTTAKGE
jgi:pyruvate/2-oxoglutarate dehydrogenase complex dihydrolipoamide acyltransferase (E2) component